MRIRMLTLAAGPEGVLLPGAVILVAEELGRRLVAQGYAEWVEKDLTGQTTDLSGQGGAGVETAEAAPAPERAVSRRGKKR